MKSPTNIYDFIKQQESLYAQEIEVMENWNWCMKDHIRTAMLFKHGKFLNADNEIKTKNPFKNIVYPILNLRYRAEDIDLKDVILYVNDSEKYHLSFLVKKYHDEVYAKENHLDTFFDETKEEKIDFGGTLVRKAKDGPLLEPLESIAFCDQTDILSGPIGFKLFFSPDQLYDMEKQGWGKESNGANITIEELITLADEAKEADPQKNSKNQTPGKYIEIYRVHGSLPIQFLKDEINPDDERYVRQLHIVAFYKGKDGQNQGVTLYKKREYENPFKVHLAGKKIKNRALAYGGVEELSDPQVWTNYSEIRKKDMLDAASKVILQTTDEAYSNRNKIKDMENLEITVTREGTKIDQIPNGSPNIQLFNEWINEWNLHGQTTSGATDALMGKNPASGTPFRLENLVTQQGMGLHDYRQGKFATFIEEIYNDWILDDIKRKIVNGTKFLATLDANDLQYVSDCLVRNEWENYKKEKILNGEEIYPEEEEAFKEKVRKEVAAKGNKYFIEILKGEFENAPLSIQVNITNKQKNLFEVVDKLSNVFNRIIMMQRPLTQEEKKILGKIIEYSGLQPNDFAVPYGAEKPEFYADQQTQVPQLPTKQPALV